MVLGFIVLLVISRILVLKLNNIDEDKSEVHSMKIKTAKLNPTKITANTLAGSLEVIGAIGANILAACLLT